MRRFYFLAALLVAVFCCSPLCAQAPRKSKARDQTLALNKMLDQFIDTKGLQEPVKLKCALEYFADKFGGKLPMIVDKEAFMEIEANADPYESDVKLPPVPSKMTMRTALRLIVAQIPHARATYMVRPSHVEIITAERNQSAYLLRALVTADHQRRPLHEVLEELADATGLSINLDTRLGTQANSPITATFRNMPLEDALVTATESAGLKYVTLHNSVFVTTPKRAKEIAKEEVDRKARRLPEPPVPSLQTTQSKRTDQAP